MLMIRRGWLVVTSVVFHRSGPGADPHERISIHAPEYEDTGWFRTEISVRFGLLTRLRAALRLILRGTFNVSFWFAVNGEDTFIDDIEFEIGE